MDGIGGGGNLVGCSDNIGPVYPPFHSETRPWFFDQMWKLQSGQAFMTGQGGETPYTSLSADVTAGATTLPVVDGSVFVAKQLLVVSNGVTDNQVVWISSIAGNNLTTWPGIKTGGFVSGTRVAAFWHNASHPSTYGHYALAYKLANAYRYECMTGFNLLGTAGDFETTYTDTNGETEMGVGWESINPLTFAAGRNDFVNAAGYLHYARNVKGFYCADIDSTGGIRTIVPMAVKPGETYVVSFFHRAGGGEPPFTVVDADTPTTVIATNMFAAPITLSINALKSVIFTIPAGTKNIELRAVATGNNMSLTLDDVRVIRARDSSTFPRYLIEDPGNSPISILGDSWGAVFGANFKIAIEARLGKTITLVNASVAGDNLAQMNARFATQVLPYNPKYCIAQFGANDITARTDTQNEGDIDLFINNCRSNGIVPIILGQPMINGYWSASTVRNDKLRARCDLVTE